MATVGDVESVLSNFGKNLERRRVVSFNVCEDGTPHQVYFERCSGD
jgi:hypothetical protein